MQIYDLFIGEMLFQLQEILICHIVRAASEFFRVRQGSPLFFAEACVIALLQGAPVIWSQASALGRSYMMLGAIMEPLISETRR